MKHIISFCILLNLVLTSCVSESEHQIILDENYDLLIENQKLKDELEGIKYGAPNLISDGKKFYNANEFSKARNKFQTLLNKHPDLPESIVAKEFLIKIDEEETWYNAKKSEELNLTIKYITDYPNGKYITLANIRKEELKIIHLQNIYENAKTENTSYAWKNFLDEYPYHVEANKIKDKIIRLEVDEIMGKSSTGKMPSFNQESYGNSSTSYVEITNNTGCNLIVRYSGIDAKVIEIPEGSTQSVYLKSGEYKVVASACSENYAGVENLQGSYSSSFFIKRRSY